MKRYVPDPVASALGAISERMLKDLPDHPATRRMQAEVNRLRGGVEALDKVHSSRSPLDTPAAHAMKVAKLARKFDSEITAMINRLGQCMRESAKDAQRRIDEKVNLKPDAFAAEIRAAFRGLDSKAKIGLLGQLAKENRGPELAAIVKAPPFLAGITEDQRAAFESSILGIHAGPEVEEIQSLEDAFGAAMAAQRAASGFVSRLTDPHVLGQIERDTAVSEAASDAFNETIQ